MFNGLFVAENVALGGAAPRVFALTLRLFYLSNKSYVFSY